MVRWIKPIGTPPLVVEIEAGKPKGTGKRVSVQLLAAGTVTVPDGD